MSTSSVWNTIQFSRTIVQKKPSLRNFTSFNRLTSLEYDFCCSIFRSNLSHLVKILGGIHKPRVQMSDKKGGQMATLQHKPFFVKVSKSWKIDSLRFTRI